MATRHKAIAPMIAVASACVAATGACLTGVAIARHAPHSATAQKSVELLRKPAAQKIFVAAELEYPVLATAERAAIVADIGAFVADALPIYQIAAHQQAAIALFKKVGFNE
ncbi:hypothetical protein [Bradyrhizobium sp. BR 10289]|uniref:hypothetical protein n=1 Tax=Bradyrhizobium sp. BR 10289 TaxID=2749993 RepID=UPI001E47138E|nr:hypothetical protein [Bradyrhizobium sp. BR 10289]